MNRIPMSAAAAGLMRALIARANVPRNRVLLTDAKSIDWRSLTFAGERHVIELRIPGPDSRSIVEHMCKGLEEVEFNIAGVIVADIAAGLPSHSPDGSTAIRIEALTVTED